MASQGPKDVGANRMAKKLGRAKDIFIDDVANALYRRGNAVMRRSKREFVPVDLSALKTSGFVDLPDRRFQKIRVRLGYGGTTAPYAVVVHEHPSPMSPPTWRGAKVTFHPRGRGPKYLERPLLEAVKTMAQEIAQEVNIERAARKAGDR